METNIKWTREFPGAITVTDKNGIILEMNEKACETFEKDGGKKLIGQNVLDCHPNQAQLKIKELMISGKINSYTIEKNGIKKLIYQCPWYENGQISGMVELSLPIPEALAHFIRD